MTTINITYEVNDTVPEDGLYVCVPCGHSKKFTKGERFLPCLSCMQGREYKDEEFIEGIEMWERIS